MKPDLTRHALTPAPEPYAWRPTGHFERPTFALVHASAARVVGYVERDPYGRWTAVTSGEEMVCSPLSGLDLRDVSAALINYICG